MARLKKEQIRDKTSSQLLSYRQQNIIRKVKSLQTLERHHDHGLGMGLQEFERENRYNALPKFTINHKKLNMQVKKQQDTQ